MRRKFSFRALAVLMAILTAVITPLQAIAASQKEYIQEIRIGYGEEGKKTLTDAGYTVWEDLDANEGGTGSAVYLGYKTTTVKEDAVTDIAVMPMTYGDGAAYSFEAYQTEMENLSKQIDQMLENFDAAIAEFRTNLAKPAPENDYALRAYTLLNMYIEDDTNLPVGKLFANGELDSEGNFVSYTSEPNTEAYHNILMMGNSTAVGAIKTALAMGCTETNGETFLDRLAETEYPDEIPASLNEGITILSDSISELQSELATAQKIYNEAESFEGGREAYLEALSEEDPDSLESAISSLNLVDTMKETPYGNVEANGKGMDFLSVMTLSTDATSSDELKLNSNLLSMLASVMTPGQIAISQYVNLTMLINNASSTKLEKTDGHFALEATDSYLEQLEQIETISVYLGVDRSVFADGDYGTVAITDAAIRNGIDNENFGVVDAYNTEAYNTAKIALGVSAGVCALAATGCIVYAAKTWGTAEKIISETVKKSDIYKVTYINKATGVTQQANNVAAHGLNDLQNLKDEFQITNVEVVKEGETYTKEFKQYYTSTGTKITAVAGAIFAAAAIVLAVLSFVASIQEPEPVKVTYTDIPRAIIDVKRETNGEDKYFVYYAARLAGASDDYKNEEDTTKLYGDLNGLNSYEPWLCLYYAKDLRLGSPLTTNILVKNASTLTTMQKKKYVPVHDFFNNTLVANNTDYAAFDLNQTSQKENHPSIYAFFQRDTSVAPLTSTILEENASFNWVAIVTFFVGAGLAAGATGLVMKRKSRKPETAQA